MWQQIYDSLKKLLLLKEQTDKNTTDVKELKELQREVKELTAVVQHLIYEVRGNRNDEAHERENMALRLQNELLKFERRLPPPG